SGEDLSGAASMLVCKAEILAKGAGKRGRHQEAESYLKLRSDYLKMAEGA
ncbi:MAG: glycosyltransferase family 2 protein, partial [bacterium]|nr:glycosyltransferase family 2 protein [bacterium]